MSRKQRCTTPGRRPEEPAQVYAKRAASAAMRVAYVVAEARHDEKFYDAAYYELQARVLLDGHGYSDPVRFLPGAIEYARGGAIPGGLGNNREFVGACVEKHGEIPAEIENLLYDPQTSGGLLVAIAESAAAAAVEALKKRDVAAARIGRVVEKQSPLLRLL